MRLADLARVEQDAFRHGRLAGIDVSHDANVADMLRSVSTSSARVWFLRSK